MRNLMLMGVLVLFGFLVGCGPYKAYYDIDLKEVERHEHTQARYGGQTITEFSDNTQNHVFEDGLIKVIWQIKPEYINLFLHNKKNALIRIFWDRAVYVDEHGLSYRIVHSGVRTSDTFNAQVPSPIAHKSHRSDTIYSAEPITYYNGTGSNGSPLTYSTYTLLPFINKSSRTALEETVRRLLDQTVQVLLPIEADGEIHEYLFSFRINKGWIYTGAYRGTEKAKEVR